MKKWMLMARKVGEAAAPSEAALVDDVVVAVGILVGRTLEVVRTGQVVADA